MICERVSTKTVISVRCCLLHCMKKTFYYYNFIIKSILANTHLTKKNSKSKLFSQKKINLTRFRSMRGGAVMYKGSPPCTGHIRYCNKKKYSKLIKSSNIFRYTITIDIEINQHRLISNNV